MRVAAAVLLLTLALGSPAAAWQEDPEAGSRRARLDALRDNLVALELEKALAGIEVLLGEPGLTEAERAEALILRSQTHVAIGDLSAAEADYREILPLRPNYVPDTSLTPKKAMTRFDKVRSEIIGELVLIIDPPGARLFIDDAEITIGPEGRLDVLVGTRTLRVERAGFDTLTQQVVVAAGRASELSLQLVPNARSILVRTDPAGVELSIDGEFVGRTEPPGLGSGPGELFVHNVALGEHLLELRKRCHRTVRRTEMLTADLLDRSPKRYDTVRLALALVQLELSGGPEGGELFIDGESRGRLPVGPLDVCPEAERIEVRVGDRRVWTESLELAGSQRVEMQVTPRPNLALVGREAWPPGLEDTKRGYNVVTGVEAPRGADLTTVEGWQAVALPAGCDVALAGVGGSSGEPDTLYLYSPILRSVARLSGSMPAAGHPGWERGLYGIFLVDSAIGGPAVVAQVVAGGPAARAGIAVGDRLLTLDGAPVESAQAAERVLGSALPAGAVHLAWTTRAGEKREARFTSAVSPHLELPVGAVEAFMRAAWARMSSEIAPGRAAAATANLALLLSVYGQHALAVDTWGAVGWPERSGLGNGTAQYYLGCDLQRLGREREAIEALRRAAASDATVFDDEGPRVAPAARDRLADLGDR